MPLKILTWNINGIRAVKGKTMKQLLDSLQADIICLQETKVTRDMLDEPTAIVEGYDSYFSFSRKRTGYSGTATYCGVRALPLEAEEGLTGRLSTSCEGIINCYGITEKYFSDLDALDAEGRCIITLHQIRLPDDGLRNVAVINVYVPRAGDKQERLLYKLKFLSLLQSRAEAMLEQKIHVIILGDLNLTHRKIDNCDPESNLDFQLKSSQIWMNKFLQKSQSDSTLPKEDFRLASVALSNLKGGMFSDSYRHLHSDQENAFTNWNSSTDARRTNYGRRLDYILVDTELVHYVSSCEIMADVEGSDHCPVVVTLNCDPVFSKVCPQLCSKYMPEFKGQQQKLSSFFFKSLKQNDNQIHSPNSSLSSSPGDLQEVSSFPVQKFDNISGSQSLLKRNAKNSVQLTSTQPEKRKVTTVKQKNAKKMKRQDETATKHISLTSFFAKADSKVRKVTETRTGIIGNYQIEHAEDMQTTSTDLAGSTSLSVQEFHTSSITNASKSGVLTAGNNSSTTTTAAPTTSKTTTTLIASQAWKSLLTGPPPPPLCSGHKEPCILKTVNKKGPNKNKKFYVCARPEGAPGNPDHRCNYFLWYNSQK